MCETAQLIELCSMSCKPVNVAARDGVFDAAPLLELILQDESPEEMAANLDQAMTSYVNDMCTTGSGEPGLHQRNVYWSLRMLRNAILKGATGLDLNK